MDWLSANFMCIENNEKDLFIPTKEATLDDVITTLLEGTINMINCMFAQETYFLLILTIDSKDKTNISKF